jgi:hypothetical protein
MGKPFIDLTNQTYNSWTVTGPHKSMPRSSGKGSPRTHWFCTCRCGNTAWVDATNLRQGISKNCGCLRKIVAGKGSAVALAAAKANTTHGLSGSPFYARYNSMINRCYNPANKSYPWYGAKGITVCDRWRESFENFLADMGPSYSPGLSLERNDVKQGYSPENCKWIPRREQNWNTNKTVRLPNGDRLRRFCFEHGLDYDAFYFQIVKKGLTLNEVLDLYHLQVTDDSDSLSDVTIEVPTT